MVLWYTPFMLTKLLYNNEHRKETFSTEAKETPLLCVNANANRSMLIEAKTWEAFVILYWLQKDPNQNPGGSVYRGQPGPKAFLRTSEKRLRWKPWSDQRFTLITGVFNALPLPEAPPPFLPRRAGASGGLSTTCCFGFSSLKLN